MRKIWKYDIPIKDTFTLQMPKDAWILSIGTQNEEGCLWVLVDPDEVLEDRIFRLFDTGQTISEDLYALHFIGRLQKRGGALIWHLFEFGYKTAA